MSGVRLFVYGTLRRGGSGARLLGSARPAGAATVAGTLYDVGGRYPALVLGGGATVHGEVWICDEPVLAALDAYEGVPEGLFRREWTEVGGEPALVYVAGPLLLPTLRAEQRIASGRWPAR